MTFPEKHNIIDDSKGGKQGEISVGVGKNPRFMEAFAGIKKALSVPACSTAKIVLNGLGADEVFGGYSRYYAYLKSGQTEELKAEFSLGTALGNKSGGRPGQTVDKKFRQGRQMCELSRETMHISLSRRAGAGVCG